MEPKKEVITLIQDTNNKVNLGSQYRHSFEVDFTNVDPKFKGNFEVRYPNQIDRMTIGVKRADLTRGLPVDVITDNLITMISTLDTILVERPTWFDISDPMIDYDIVYTIYMQYIEWQDTFRRSGSGTGAETTSGE